jgi:hypothetical protein
LEVQWLGKVDFRFDAVTKRLFAEILRLIAELRPAPPPAPA